jgi:SpoVK/Ycf46/Vps4 family AAA+-type ATPase
VKNLFSEELRKIASEKANEAIKLDKQGNYSMAILKYRQVIDILFKLYNLTEDPTIKKVYYEKMKSYEERIRVLESMVEGESIKIEEVAKFDDLVLKEKPKVSWDDVIGLEDAKKSIRESIVYPVKRPDLFPLGWPKGILLYGPPGCGKTLLAAAVASEIDATFYYVDAASIISKWLGESEKNVARLFSSARKSVSKDRPAIIFIDEIDSLTSIHQVEVGGETRARNQILKEMDGLSEKSKNEHLYVIGATNKPWDLDEPFIRRFQKRIYVPLPNKENRLALFKHYTKDLALSNDVDFEELAILTNGYSGNDIRDICMSVQIKVVRELFESGAAEKGMKPRLINMFDFLEAIKIRRPSVSFESIRKYEEWARRWMAL